MTLKTELSKTNTRLPLVECTWRHVYNGPKITSVLV